MEKMDVIGRLQKIARTGISPGVMIERLKKIRMSKVIGGGKRL